MNNVVVGSEETTAHPLTLADINRRNQRFASERAEQMSTQVQDETLVRMALHTISAEMEMLTPVRHRRSFEQALEHAEDMRKKVLSGSGRKGGKVAKTDALQRIIESTSRIQPEITTHQLLIKIRKLADSGDSIVIKVDRRSELLLDELERIHFMEDGVIKTAPVAALKDRLYRAKKKLSR